MTTDVGIVVGIKADDSGARVIKRSLDDVAVANKKVEDTTKAVETAAIRASIAEKALAADTQKVNAATVAAAAAQGKAENAMRSAAVGAAKLAEAEKRLGLEAQKTATATLGAAAAQQRAENAMLSAALQAKRLADSQEKIAAATQNTSRILSQARTAFLSYMSAQTVKNVLMVADGFQGLNGRIREATRETGDYNKVQKDLLALSKETGTAFGANVTLFQRLANSRGDLGATNEEIIRLVETVGKLGAVGGASTEEIKNGSIQMAQALSGGTVRAEEFNSMVENLNPIVQAVAKQFGIKFGELRQRVIDGTLSSKEFAQAIIASGDEADAAFGRLPASLGRSVETMKTSFGEFIDKANQSYDITSTLAGGLNTVSDNMGTMAAAIGTVAAAGLPLLLNEMRLGVISLTSVMLANPIMLGLTAASVIITGVVLFRDELAKLADPLYTFADVWSGVETKVSDVLDRLGARATRTKLDFAGMFGGLDDAQKAQYAAAEAKIGSNPVTLADAVGQASSNRIASEYDAYQRELMDADQKAGQVVPPSAVAATENAKQKRTREKAERDAKREADKIHKEAERAAAKEQREALAEEKRQQNELQSAINGSRTEFEKLNDEIAHLEKLKGVAKTAEQVELLNRGIRNTQTEIDKLALKAELDSPLAKGFAAVADEVQDGFKDAFKSAFDKGGNLFEKMADGIKATFKSLLLDLAYQAAVRPIVVSVLTSVGGSLGLSGSAVSSVLGKTGGSSTAGLFGNGSSLLSLGRSFLSGGSLTSGLAARSLPLSTSLGFGPQGAGNIANFIKGAGTAANIGGGFVGGTAASLLGLGNKNGYVNAGASAIGGLIGQAAIPIPFVGAAIGSFAGSALAGLFGGAKPSDKAQWGGINLADAATFGTGGLSGKKYSDENAKFRDGVLGNAGQLAQLLKGAGGSTSGSLFVTVGNRDGLRLGTGGNEQNFRTNQQAFIDAVMKQVVNSTTGLNATMQQILTRTGTGDLNALAGNFEFGKAYDQLGKVADPLGDALTALNSQFDAMRQTANNLGFPLEKINTEYAKQKQAVEENIKAQQAGFSSFADLTKAFDGFFNSQALGDNSSLNPLQKLGVAQSSFGDLLKKAQGGDLSVTQDLLSSANTLLGLGRDTYASGADFTGLESFVKSSVSSVAKQSGYSGNPVVSVIQQGNDAIVSVLLKILESTNKAAADSFRAANKAAVGA